jgi:hypothetical protein
MEEYLGTRYARQALDLDRAYQPAQVVFLSLTLERNLQDKQDLLLTKGLPLQLHQLLATLDTDLLVATLERAMADRNVPVMIPLIQTLGSRGEARAVQPPTAISPSLLVRCLNYPDRRVQMAAAQAIWTIPGPPPAGSPLRVVEVLSRFLAASPTPKVLIAPVPQDVAAEVRKRIQDAGFEPIVAASLKDAFAALRTAADIDAIILHPALPENELPFALAQLRADNDVGLLPLHVLTPLKAPGPSPRLLEKHPNVFVLPEAILLDGQALKQRLEDTIKMSAAPALLAGAPEENRGWLEAAVLRNKSLPLSAAERKRFANLSLDALWRMSTGEFSGFDVRPARRALIQTLRSPDEDTAWLAMQTLSRIPGAEVQQRLADVVLDPKRAKLRPAAAFELNRHLQKYGLGLTADQVARLRTLASDAKEDAALRAQLALLVGSLRTTPAVTGDRLYQFKQ